jgi:acyl carrier protein phosphodiesterase
MNYLAHLFLAGPNAESLLGNLAGDFVKGRLEWSAGVPPAVTGRPARSQTAAERDARQLRPGRPLSLEIRRGIVQHRKIDEFTDTHPAVGAFRRVIAAEHGHYARVIADVFFDHFLACDWNDYSQESFDDFLRRVFAALDPLVDAMPGRLRFVYPMMRDGRWLESYADFDGIHIALRNLSRRFSRAPQLEGSTQLLRDARGTLHAHFRRFFPDVVEYAKRIR